MSIFYCCQNKSWKNFSAGRKSELIRSGLVEGVPTYHDSRETTCDGCNEIVFIGPKQRADMNARLKSEGNAGVKLCLLCSEKLLKNNSATTVIDMGNRNTTASQN